MWTLIIIAIVAIWAWFFFTDRRNTVTATKTSLGVVGGTLKSGATIIVQEAKIAKQKNEIADLETDRIEKFADRNAARIVASVYEDIGLGKEFLSDQEKRLAQVKSDYLKAVEKNKAKKAASTTTTSDEVNAAS